MKGSVLRSAVQSWTEFRIQRESNPGLRDHSVTRPLLSGRGGDGVGMRLGRGSGGEGSKALILLKRICVDGLGWEVLLFTVLTEIPAPPHGARGSGGGGTLNFACYMG